MNPVLSTLQIIGLIAAGLILFRVYRTLKELPQDAVLGDECSRKLCAQLTVLMCLAAAEAVLSIVQIVLRFI